jgi:hypothetical protein
MFCLQQTPTRYEYHVEIAEIVRKPVIDWECKRVIFRTDGTTVPIKIDDPKNRPRSPIVIRGQAQ